MNIIPVTDTSLQFRHLIHDLDDKRALCGTPHVDQRWCILDPYSREKDLCDTCVCHLISIIQGEHRAHAQVAQVDLDHKDECHTNESHSSRYPLDIKAMTVKDLLKVIEARVLRLSMPGAPILSYDIRHAMDLRIDALKALYQDILSTIEAEKKTQKVAAQKLCEAWMSGN